MRAAPPTVSIIVPTYNRRAYVIRALDSIFSQTFTDYEVILIDNGSIDHTTPALQSRYPNHPSTIIRFATNQGPVVARNKGIRAARGQFIAFLDSDDRWLPQYLHTQLQSLQHHPQAALSYCDYFSSAQGHAQVDRVSLTPQQPDLITAMLLGNFIHTLSQVMLPANVFQRIGLFDERLPICHDREFYLRLFAHAAPVHVTQFLVQKQWLPDGLVAQSRCQAWLTDGLQLLDIFFNRPENQSYAPLRAQAETILRSRVASSQRYFSRVFPVSSAQGRSPTSPQSVQPIQPIARPIARANYHSTARLRPPIHAATRYTPASELWLVTCYFNSSHYRTKLLNYQKFRERIDGAGLSLLTIECAFGDDEFDLAPADDVLQLRSPAVLWQKERLLNLAIAALPERATKVAWLDCDILFSNPHWAVETAQLLDQYPIVQLSANSIRLRQGQDYYNGDAEGVWDSFAQVHAQQPEQVLKGNAHRHGHSGYAWAARREVIQKHGLYDAMVVGAADHLMAHAMCNDFSSPCVQRHMGVDNPHFLHFLNWGKAFYGDIRGRIGVVKGNILHMWHGDLAQRRYVDRHDQLAKYGFDPNTDIRIGASSTWEWCSDKPDLHRWIVDYFQQRQEDGEQ